IERYEVWLREETQPLQICVDSNIISHGSFKSVSNKEVYDLEEDRPVWNSQCRHSVLKFEFAFIKKAVFFDPTASQYGRIQKVIDEEAFQLKHVKETVRVCGLSRPNDNADPRQWFEVALMKAIQAWAKNSSNDFADLHSLMFQANEEEYGEQKESFLTKMRACAREEAEKRSRQREGR
ncbi:MAG: hypothetical protein Q9160_009069, partial [Pyrenula sp. 1 TL-2023]